MRASRPAWLTFAGSLTALLIFRFVLTPRPRFGDLAVYRAEGTALRTGADLYAQLPGVHELATYPPFAAILFVPLSLLPWVLAQVVYFAGTVAVLAWCGVASCRLAGLRGRHADSAGLVLTAAALWCEPVWSTFGYGQINLIILALVLRDFVRPTRSARSTGVGIGIGIGLAAAIKVTPAIFIGYLLLTRRWRAAATAIGTFAVALAVSTLADPRGTWAYWTRYLIDPLRVGRLENSVNQTIRGMLVRVEHTRDTPSAQELLVVATLIAGLTVAVLGDSAESGDSAGSGDSWGVPACAVTGLLCSPISWSHHWVWCIPIVALLWVHARAWLLLFVPVFWCFVVWVPAYGDARELHLRPALLALSVVYVYAGLAFLALVAVRTARTSVVPRPELAETSRNG